MRKSSYFTSPERAGLEAEVEPNLDLPIIDIVRHGDSDYSAQKEFMGRMYEQQRPLGHAKYREIIRDGQNKSELIPEGLAAIQESARQLAGQINAQNEMVFVVSSPISRAWETADVFIKALQEANPGIKVLNRDKKLEAWLLKGVGPTAERIQDKELEEQGINDSGNSVPTVPEWRSQSSNEDKVDKTIENNFNNFLRHAINYKQYLSPQSLESIQGKRLRIICFTHNELTEHFLSQTFGGDKDDNRLANAQIVEIKPQDKLPQGGSTNLKVKVYPKEDSPQKEANVELGFNGKEN